MVLCVWGGVGCVYVGVSVRAFVSLCVRVCVSPLFIDNVRVWALHVVANCQRFHCQGAP